MAVRGPDVGRTALRIFDSLTSRYAAIFIVTSDAAVGVDNLSKCALRPFTSLALAGAIVAEAILSGGDKKHVEVRLPEYKNVLATQAQASSASTAHLSGTGIGYSVGRGRLSWAHRR